MNQIWRRWSTSPIPAAVRSSIQLLSRRERTQYVWAVLFQMATALLDLLGVLLIGLVGFLAASMLDGGGPPSLVAQMQDRLGVEGIPQEQLTLYVASVAAGLLILKSAVYGLLMKFIYRVLGRSQSAASARIASQVANSPIDVVELQSSQTVSFAMIHGASAAFIGVLGSVAILLADSALIVVLGSALLFINPQVTFVVVLLFGAVGVGLQRAISHRSHSLGSAQSLSAIGTYEAMQESIAAHREIEVLSRQSLIVGRVSRLVDKYALALSDSFFLSQLPKLVYESTLVVGGVALAIWQFSVSGQATAVTTLAIFLAAASRLVPSMLRINVQAASLASSAAQAQTLYSVAVTTDEYSSPPVPKPAEFAIHESQQQAKLIATSIRSGYEGFAPVLDVVDVSYRYPNAHDDTLHSVSFSVSAGSSLAIVGPTGSGKSTLADLVLGVRLPSSGSIRIGGFTPRVAESKFPGAVGYVPQRSATFDASVRENVALGLDPNDIDDLLVWDALERAHLASFIRSSPEGLDTPVGERGLRLSGGQNQRLGLARALYSRPRFVVLDEATSALDATTEASVTDSIATLETATTVIVIAHRLTTVRHCHKVAYLAAGSVQAIGTFEEIRRAIPDFDEQARLSNLR